MKKVYTIRLNKRISDGTEDNLMANLYIIGEGVDDLDEGRIDVLDEYGYLSFSVSTKILSVEDIVKGLIEGYSEEYVKIFKSIKYVERLDEKDISGLIKKYVQL